MDGSDNKNHILDEAIEPLMPYIRDRNSASLVCRRWFKMDSETRIHVTIPFCYSVTPDRLSRRFPYLWSLKIKGKPRAETFSHIPRDWGYVTPWVNEISNSLKQLKSVHFKGMIVWDSDLHVLARARLDNLETLKLDRCSGFSSNGLLSITTHCRKLKVLSVKACSLIEITGKWFHELALHNTSLKVLDLYATEFVKINAQDLVTIARNCRDLVFVKLRGLEISNLSGFFRAAANLEEFWGGSSEDMKNYETYMNLCFSPKLCRIGLSSVGTLEMPRLSTLASRIRKLDLVFVVMCHEDHCKVIQKCPNLEALEVNI